MASIVDPADVPPDIISLDHVHFRVNTYTVSMHVLGLVSYTSNSSRSYPPAHICRRSRPAVEYGKGLFDWQSAELSFRFSEVDGKLKT